MAALPKRILLLAFTDELYPIVVALKRLAIDTLQPRPIPMFRNPVVLFKRAFVPTAVLECPVELSKRAFVPIAVFTSLGDTNDNRENAVRNFADIYNLAGMRYDVQSYV